MNAIHAARRVFRGLRDFYNGIVYAGKGRFCPICGKTSSALGPAGIIRRDDARCMHCRSLERDRLVWLFFMHKTDLFDGRIKKMLHVAPERCLFKPLKDRLGNGYITADLNNPEAMVKMDITDIRFPNESFDVIFCSHVLEHVSDDVKALAELYRVLKKTGWAVIQVPIVAEKTQEFTHDLKASHRTRLYGHPDHVRNYGADYIERLQKAGFQVNLFTRQEILERADMEKVGINEASGEIYYCRKAP